MTLYLSPYRFGDSAGQLRHLVGPPRRALVIANALDFSTDLVRKEARVEAEIAQLKDLGFAASQLDLRRFFRDPGSLDKRFQGVGLIWTLGGNSFLLRRAMRQSGLDLLLTAWRDDAGIVYGGYSAGAVVATPTLRGIHLVDPPDALAEGYPPEIIWDGLALVPYSIAPHYDSPNPESKLMEGVIEYFREHRMPFKALRDGEVIITRALTSVQK